MFARTLGLARHADDAAVQVAAAMAQGSVRRIAVGRANDRVFLFHVGIGFDAAVVQQVERRMRLKRTVGQALFAFATWLRHYDHRRPRFAVEFGDGSVLSDWYFSIWQADGDYLGQTDELVLSHEPDRLAVLFPPPM